MVLRCSCITSPVLFHPLIPPSHTLFMLLLNLADCQFPGLLFHQVAFFHYLADGSPTPLPHPRHYFFHFLFTSLFTLFYLPLFLPMQVSPFLSLSLSISISHSLPFPLSVHRRCNWNTTFPHIVIFKSPFASQRRESDCFIIFRFLDMVLGREKVKINVSGSTAEQGVVQRGTDPRAGLSCAAERRRSTGD